MQAKQRGTEVGLHDDRGMSRIYSEPWTSTSAPVYTRGIVLRHSGADNGTALVTFEHDIHRDPAVFPIYRSRDNGATWTFITNVVDTEYGLGLRGQPDLFELPHDVANLKQGTILLTGSVQPVDQSSTSLVVYKSTDQGNTWSYISTVDTGGPAVYDSAPASITTPIWEPHLYIDAYGNLVVTYSDERHKAKNILQAVVHRTSSDGGQTWGPLVVDISVPNRHTRPGMMTVAKLPNGKYFGAYEIVGLPEAPVYGRFSDDGQDWGDPTDLGTLLATSAGNFLFGSPHLLWVDAGGPDGMLVVNGQRYVTPAGSTKSMFLTNTNLGVGDWEPMPQPIQITGDLVRQAGFKQTTAASVDNTRLIQFTTVNNAAGMHDVVTATAPLNSIRYPASTAAVTGGARLVERSASMTGQVAGYINDPGSGVTFSDVVVPKDGPYALRVRFSNGTGSASSHNVAVNEQGPMTLSYNPTFDWNSFDYATVRIELAAGANTVTVSYHSGFAELDLIEVFPLPEVRAGEPER